MNPFGYIKDTSDSGLDFSSILRPKLVQHSNGDIDLSKYASHTNQLEISACAGNATADAVEIINAIDEETRALAESRPENPQPQLSRMFIYTLARNMMDENKDNQGDVDKDDGTYIRLCFEVLSRFGICEESVWPYLTSKVYVLPSLVAMRQAFGHKIHSYYRIKEEGKDKLDAIISALRSKHPVVFGTQIDKEFEKLNGPSTIDKPNGNISGSHAMIIVGYMNGLFKVKNSWGKYWRDGGYCYLTPEYVSWNETWDLWVPTNGSVFT